MKNLPIKVPFRIDKHAWSPSVIPGPIMLVTTVNQIGEPNAAPKSWVQMVAFDPPTLMFSGQKGNPTENNIEETGCFALNVVDESLYPSAISCVQWHGVERIERSNWTLIPASQIAAPLIAESPAHLECELDRTIEVGSGYIIIARIVAGSINEQVAHATSTVEKYALLNQCLFLENKVRGSINAH